VTFAPAGLSSAASLVLRLTAPPEAGLAGTAPAAPAAAGANVAPAAIAELQPAAHEPGSAVITQSIRHLPHRGLDATMLSNTALVASGSGVAPRPAVSAPLTAASSVNVHGYAFWPRLGAAELARVPFGMVALALSTPLAFARPLALALTPSGGAVPDDVFVAVRFGAAVLPVELEPALPFTGNTTASASGTRGARLLLLLGFPMLMLPLARLVLLLLARLVLLPLARLVPLPLVRLLMLPLARLLMLPLPKSRGKAAIDALPFLPAESAAFCAGTSSPIATE